MKKLATIITIIIVMAMATPTFASANVFMLPDLMVAKLINWDLISLNYGDNNKSVYYTQVLLKASGFEIDTDGSFGPETQKTICYFQILNDMEVTGVPDSDFYENLESCKIYTADEISSAIEQYQNEFTVADTAESSSGNSYTNGYGDAGRLYIPSAGISVALYWQSVGNYEYNQWITDCADSALLAYDPCNYIADHNNQSFSTLTSVNVGDTCYIEYSDGSRQYYECVYTDIGQNTETNLIDDYGYDMTWNNYFDLNMYTCYNGWQIIFICHWVKC